MNALQHRCSLRRKGYDYAHPGAYYVTICMRDRTYLFGDVAVGAGSEPAPTKPNHIVGAGSQPAPTKPDPIVRTGSQPAPTKPITIVRAGSQPAPIKPITIVRAGSKPAPTKSNSIVRAGSEPAPTKPITIVRAGSKPAPTKHYRLPEIVRALKTFSVCRINQLRGTPGAPVRQRNNYEHMIRTTVGARCNVPLQNTESMPNHYAVRCDEHIIRTTVGARHAVPLQNTESMPNHHAVRYHGRHGCTYRQRTPTVGPIGGRTMTHTHPLTKLPKTSAHSSAGSVQTESAERADSRTFLLREVLPYAPDAWYDSTSIKVGYEINFNRYFYKPKALRTLEEIHADIFAVEKELQGLLNVIFGG